MEIHREYDGGPAPSLERRSLDVMDDRQRVATIETEGARRLVRYQGVDHLGSARLETDETGRVISYEEFHPFGTTAYQSVDRDVAAAAKRYRYTGMERDDESGLEYHAARYYAPWLGRWTAPDTHPEQLDGNRYAYVKNNPVVHSDSNGQSEEAVHGILTYRLALAAGFPQADAARLAIATAAIDHDDATRSATEFELPFLIRIPQTIRYHYPNDPYATVLRDVNRDIAEQRAGTRRGDDMERFGAHLHVLQDIGFSEAPGPHMRHDPGAPTTRLLQPVLAIPGLVVTWGALSLGAALLHSSWSTGEKVGAGIAIGFLLGLGIYALVVAIATSGIGHPSFAFERGGGRSSSFSHEADQAFRDPAANTEVLLRVWDKLKEYRRARYGNVNPDEDAARAAIEEAVSADSSARISSFADTRPLDVNGVRVPSYSEILCTRRTDRWNIRQLDASFPREKWQYQGRVTCPR